MSYFYHLTVSSIKAGLSSVSPEYMWILLYRVWGAGYAMEPNILEIALDLILTLHSTFMASLVGNSVVVIIQTFTPSSPVYVPDMRKSFPEGLWFVFPRVAANMCMVS